MSPPSKPPVNRIQPSTLRVWNEDLPALRSGEKTEYRQLSQMVMKPLMEKEYPRPVLLWATSHVGRRQELLMVCLSVRRERLMAITEESLSREGYATTDSFKRYWLLRTGYRVHPLQWVNVRHLRPWQTGDSEHFGRILLRELYGDAASEAIQAEAQN